MKTESYSQALRSGKNTRADFAKATAQLASENGFRFIMRAKPNYSRHFLPATAKSGIWERHEQIMVGTYRDYGFEMYIDTFREPFAYRLSRTALRVYCLTLPVELPHIFMRNRQTRLASLVKRHFDDDQRIELEGNYQKYYTVYSHRRMNTQVLTLLNPKLMAILVDHNDQFDLEFIGNKLYLYSPYAWMEPTQLTAALQTIEPLIMQLKHQFKTWRFTLPNRQRYPYLVSRPGFGTVNIGGRYYNKSWAFILFYSLYSVLRIVLDPTYKEIKYGIVIVSDVIMVVVLLMLRRKYQLNRRNIGR